MTIANPKKDRTHTPSRTLADLTIGDEVAVIHGSVHKGNMFPQRVTRITPTRIILDDKNAHYKNGGRRVGFSAVGISLSKDDLASAFQNEAERAERKIHMRNAQVERDAAELRQREALERVRLYAEASDRGDGFHQLIDDVHKNGMRYELFLSDLIEVVKMARAR